MKLSVIADEVSMDFEHALDVMLEYDVKSAELRSLWDTNIADLSDQQVHKAKNALSNRGMTVSCIASPFFKCDITGQREEASGQTHQATERGLDEQMALLGRCISLCDVFDTRFIRIFSFWKRGKLTDDIEERIVQLLAHPVSVAEKAGVVLLMENEHACYLGSGEDTARILRRVNSSALKCVWDPGNAFCAGETPFPDGYNAVKDYVLHVHLKDPQRTEDGIKFVRVGEGAIDYPAQFRALASDGYQGYLSLETHYRPGGNAEEGSRQCLVSLNEILAGI